MQVWSNVRHCDCYSQELLVATTMSHGKSGLERTWAESVRLTARLTRDLLCVINWFIDEDIVWSVTRSTYVILLLGKRIIQQKKYIYNFVRTHNLSVNCLLLNLYRGVLRQRNHARPQVLGFSRNHLGPTHENPKIHSWWLVLLFRFRNCFGFVTWTPLKWLSSLSPSLFMALPLCNCDLYR